MRKSEVRSLTGLRGVAALFVAIHHFVGPDMPAHASFYLAVDLFFVLSGYVLAYTYPLVFSSGVSGRDYSKFLYKRIARIYPAYAFFTVMYSVKLILDVHGNNAAATFLSWGNIFGNAVLLTSWGLGFAAIIGPSWSISAELFCYLLFPFLMLALARVPRLTGIGLAIIVCVGLLAVSMSGFSVTGDLDVVGNTAFSLLRALAGFSAGLLLRWFGRRYRSGTIGDAALLGGVALLVLTGMTGAGDLWKFPALVLLVHAASTPSRMTARAFGSRPIHYLGEISYSLYLAHVAFVGPFSFVRRMLERSIGAEAAFALALLVYCVVVVGVAAVTYPLIEVRCKKQLLRALGRSDGPGSATPAQERAVSERTLMP